MQGELQDGRSPRQILSVLDLARAIGLRSGTVPAAPGVQDKSIRTFLVIQKPVFDI